MKIKIKNLVVIFLTIVFSPSLLAGNLNSPAASTENSSAMYTLDDIYNRLDTGAEATKRTSGFKEPSNVPTSTGNTLNDVMSKAPVKDNLNGAKPSDVAAGKKYWALSDGNWGLQTGTRATSLCSPNSSVTPVFTDNGDGTITDNRSCLIWLKDASCADLPGTKDDGRADGYTAKTAANSLASGICGLTDNSSAGDWRLPTIIELQSILDYSYYKPAISNAIGNAQWTEGDPFFGVENDYYWLSTNVMNKPNASTGWMLSVAGGRSYYYNKKEGYRYVWPVRGRQ